MNGNITLDGIRKDLLWMHEAGIGGAHCFDAGMETPQIVDHRLTHMTPEWQEAFTLAAHLTDSLGMELTIPSSPGWSATGGPWVEPQDAMKKLTWRTLRVDGGQTFTGQLPDGDIEVSSPLPADLRQGYAWIQFEFPEPETIRALSLCEGSTRSSYAAAPATYKHSLWASDDGVNFHEVAPIPVGGILLQTIDIPPTTARYFRLQFANPEGDNSFAFAGYVFPAPESTPVYELVLHPTTRINHAEEKAGFTAVHDLALYPTPQADPSSLTSTDDVVDLTARVSADGHLNWDVPQGRWQIYRFGYSLIGKQNHPASPEATGLEVDKMDPDAWTRYFRHYFDLYRQASGGLMGQRGLQYVLTDSYEATSATWTPRMMEQFRSRRGYDLTPWLPVLTGRIVGSVDESERFLWDWRKTISELLAENYDLLGRIARQEYGMKGRYSESHENGRLYLADGMEVKRDAEVSMAAIWIPSIPGAGSSLPMAQADIRESASAAHVYGGKLVAAESLTCMGIMQQAWSFCPENLKPIVDTELYSGVNRIVVHTSVHQPADDKFPGLGLMAFGQWFNRHECWAGQARAWTDYMARSSYMMQQGQYVADVAYYYGEDNNITGLFGHALPDIPEGYSFDFINADALTRLLDCRQGRLTTPSGMSYRILALDDNARSMSLPVLRRLAQLARKGAVICGTVPQAMAGRGDEEEFRQLVAEVWQSGLPNVLGGQTVAQALTGQGIEPDFRLAASDRGDSIRYVHRTIPGGPEFYWVNNTLSRPAHVTVSLRTAGRRPQLWHPETGQVDEVSYAIVDGRTEVQLDLVSQDAVFVVLAGTAEGGGITLPTKQRSTLLTVDGPWQVAFQPGRGAPQSATLPILASLSESADPGIKYFSGTATYTHTLTVPASALQPGHRLLLNLGSVGNIAEVFVGGQPVATLWEAPFEADITAALQPGDNAIEIRVTNLWPNRLIGDARPDAGEHITYTAIPLYTASDPLLPSGLMGPVILTVEK